MSGVTRNMIVIIIYKMITYWNKEAKDWSGDVYDHGKIHFLQEPNLTEAIKTVTELTGMEREDWEFTEDCDCWQTTAEEHDQNYEDDKYLADYTMTFYSTEVIKELPQP